MIARWSWREWYPPSLLIVWLTLSLTVTCVLALGNISDRMEKGLDQQSHGFMTGDRLLQSLRTVSKVWIDEARYRGPKMGEQSTFATVIFVRDTPQPANVKAVDDVHPVYGTLQTNSLGLKSQPGSVPLAPCLIVLLNLKVGDSIDVGDAMLSIAGEAVQESGSGFNPPRIVPRLMTNIVDIEKAVTVQPGNRVTWRYKSGGMPSQLEVYKK